MKLLYLMTEPFGIGGVQSDLLALSPDLTAKGHEVYVATTEGVLLDELKSKGARHVDIDFNFKSVGAALKAIFALRRAIREHQIELVAPQSVRSTIIFWLATKLLPFFYRVPVTGKAIEAVTTIHNIHNPKHFGYAGYILQACTSHVIFESHYERNRLLQGGLKADHSCVIHSGIDTDRFNVRPCNTALAQQWGLDPQQHIVFGIVARLSEEKGHNYLIQAFAQVAQAHPNARLVIVGDGPLQAEVTALVEASPVRSQIIMTGMQRNIPDFLSFFNVFVLSSTRESFPLAAREAMAAGRAVIAPRIGGCPEVVDENVTGYLFEAANANDLAQAMLKMVDQRRYVGFGQASRERVERLFSRTSWVNGDEAVYLRHLAQPR